MRVDLPFPPLDETAEVDGDLSAHIAELLRQRDDDRGWAEGIGAAYTRPQVATLMRISSRAVAQRDLLALRQRDGRIVYPVMQFEGDRPVQGLEDVVRILADVVATPWTIASWLMEPDAEGARPIDLLHDGNDGAVLLTARRLARAMRP